MPNSKESLTLLGLAACANTLCFRFEERKEKDSDRRVTKIWGPEMKTFDWWYLIT